MIRTQPPVLSPLSFSALTAAARGRHGAHALRVLHEALLREYAADDALLTGSGTQALQLAIGGAAGRDRQRIVALPAFCCFDVATAAVGANARILLYDIDPDTLAPAAASLERAFRLGARTAVIAPLYGVPVSWQPLRDIAARYDALLIEDAAQGHGARWHQRPLGAIGPLSVLSFGRGKGWTGGGGGALLWRGAGSDLRMADHALAQQRAFSSVNVVAKAAAQWALGRPFLYGVPAVLPWLGLGETKYREPGPVRTLLEAEATLLLATRSAAQREAAQRRAAGESWRERLRDIVRCIPVPAGGEAGHLRFPVRMVGAASVAALVRALRKLGAAASYPTTLAELPAVRAALVQAESWPGADTLVRELFTLPTHSLMTERDHERIVEQLKRFRNRTLERGPPTT